MASFTLTTQVPDEDWVEVHQAINLEWLSALFPKKDPTKISQWLSVLESNEFETLDDLKTLDSEGWTSLQLPLLVKNVIKCSLKATPEILGDGKEMSSVGNVDMTVDPEQTLATVISEVTQVDCIVIDISSSMRARSNIDIDKTREDVSKMLFHTLIDKLIMLELSHAVGLVSFGLSITPIVITREYEKFHDELGRLDACQGKTKLYDAIYAAAEMIEDYVVTNMISNVGEEVQKRIFVLTDGEDNASQMQPWEVANFLQSKSIVLDSIPLAGRNTVLQSMSSACRGLCFEAHSQEQSINLFESEATLHIAFRNEPETEPPRIVNASSLAGLESFAVPVQNLRSPTPMTVFSPVLTSSAASTIPGNSNCERRVLKEYRDILNSPVQGFSVFVSADNVLSWKVVMSQLPDPYTGGTWLLTFDFPSDYPFKPPKVRFITPIYHCNVNVNGGICLAVLHSEWSPALTAARVMMSIFDLMTDPNPDDALDAVKGQLLRDNKALYFAQAVHHTSQEAHEPLDVLSQRYNLAS